MHCYPAGGSQTSLDLTVSVFGEDGSLSRSHHVWPRKGRLERNQNIQSLGIVSENWIRAFKLKNESFGCESNDADQNGIFGPATIALAYLRSIHPPQSMIFLNWVFLTKIHGDLKSLLYNRDERA